MADNDDEPTKRESHFNEQRASLRSDTSQSSSNARSRSRHQSLLSHRQSLPRTAEDFDLNPDRADSEALPSPPGSPSPAPAIPRDRSEILASREKEKRRSKRSSAGRDSATSRSKSRTRAPSKGRNIEDLLIAASWENLDFLTSPPPDTPVTLSREEYWRAKLDNDASSASQLPQPSTSRNIAAPRTPTKTSRRPSLFSRSNPSNSPQSQNGITALPTMTDDAPQLSGADAYHQSQPTSKAQRTSRLLTEVYTICFLIFFAIWGTLARLGLQALTFYPGAPVVFSELWANVAGTFVMGFLAEDMRLFRSEWGMHSHSTGGDAAIAQPADRPAETGSQSLEKQRTLDKKGHSKVKKTIPLYIGLTTGFCGSFTSFSSFMRDVFLGMSNDLPAPPYHPTSAPSTLSSRDPGYSVMALLGVILITVALCFSALKTGAHLAASLDRLTPTLPFRLTRRVIDPLFVVLGLGSWLGAVLLAALLPNGHDAWRGQAVFACVFAPLGCLLRYYTSLLLNPVNPSFPLGTFVVNIFGTAVLGMSYDLQRVRISGIAGGSVIGCQVLQGIEDGFCGALTTVSTWMLELDSLRRGHGYVYGASSVVVGVSVLTVVMGSVRWSVGWEAVACAT
jgi:CrcB protein